MAINANHARQRRRLYEDTERLDRYIETVAQRLRKSRDEAAQWIEDRFSENQGDLVDVVAEGILIEGVA